MKNHFNNLTLAGTVIGLLAVSSLASAQRRNVTPPSFDVTPRVGDVTPRTNTNNVSPIPPPTFRQREEPSGLVKRGRRPIYIPVPQYYYNYGYGYWPYYAPSYGPYYYWGFPQSTYRVY